MTGLPSQFEQSNTENFTMFDLVVDAVVAGRPMKLVVEVKTQAEPRFARMAALQLKSRVQTIDGPSGRV